MSSRAVHLLHLSPSDRALIVAALQIASEQLRLAAREPSILALYRNPGDTEAMEEKSRAMNSLAERLEHAA